MLTCPLRLNKQTHTFIYIQSTLSARRVTILRFKSVGFQCISIHTPAKGVTRVSAGRILYGRDFNPHSRKGSDIRQRSCLWPILNFNPHSRKGSDHGLLIGQAVPILISIHTPAKGVTRRLKQIAQRAFISIHTPAKGVTINGMDYNIVLENFNPHSRKGSDAGF